MTTVVGQHGHVNKANTNSFNCEICGNKFVGEWTDLHGQATCINCGAPYYLVKYPEHPDMEPPELSLSPEFADAMREYWNETGKRARMGSIFIYADYPGYIEEMRSIGDWMREHYPEFIKSD